MLPPPPPSLDADATALFLDFDGTVVDLATTPRGVLVDDGLPSLLAALEARLGGAFAMVTGRRLVDLDRKLAPFRSAAAGLHGLEHRPGGDAPIRRESAGEPALAAARMRLRALAEAPVGEGLLFEDKELSIGLHYRNRPDLRGVVREAAEAALVEAGPDYMLLDAKMLFELKPRAASKGRAIEAFMARPPFAGRRPVFLGDDATDEEGFAVLGRMDGLAVAVGERPFEAARYRLPCVADVHAWLRSVFGS